MTRSEMDTALVTGAGTGIGRALSLALADQGYRVLGVGRRRDPLEETRAARPGRIEIATGDVGAEAGRRAMVAAAEAFAPIRFLVHNAAVLGPVAPLAQMPLAEWRGHMAINLEGPLFLTRDLLPYMAKGGRVLHISSGAAHAPYRGWGAYCVSKAALNMLYRCLDLELRERRVRVGSARPGVVDTPMQGEVRASSIDAFPDLPRFHQLKAEGALTPPRETARFLAWLLTQVDEDAFAAREWDIREEDSRQWNPSQ